MNLLSETIKILKENNKTLQDVEYVKLDNEYCLPGDFVKLASNIDYDDGYGLEEINKNLTIIGVNWWLERETYDGSEWWVFKTLPKKPIRYNPHLKLKTENGNSIFNKRCKRGY